MDHTSIEAPAPTVLHAWSARRIAPVMAVYVTGIFLGFMALAWFVFHSRDAVTALVTALLGSLATLGAGIVSRIDYRITETGLEKRPRIAQRSGEYREVFRWEELEEVVPTRRGFRFAKRMDEPHPLRRFWRRSIVEGNAGEVHCEGPERTRVLDLVARHGRLPARTDAA
jgi:hypothetical protein